MLETEIWKKINVRVWPMVTQALNRDLRHVHVRRDRYLDTLLKQEIERLADEITFRTPDEARARFKKRLGDLSPKPMTIVLDKEHVSRMDQVLRERNISRNSFINRVLFFLLAKPVHLQAIGIRFDRNIETLVKPLDEAWSNLTDPFFNIRSANDGEFYRLLLPEKPIADRWPSLFGLNCAISAEDWAAFSAPIPDLIDLL